MLIILTTHPIQYQVPLWQALAADGRVPFEVWYLSDHASKVSHDVEFGAQFAWDIDMLSGYPHRFLEGADRVHPAKFWNCRMREDFAAKLKQAGAEALWIQGWQVAGYWQAALAAKRAGVQLWLRGESNDLAPVKGWKKWLKRRILGRLFGRVDRFLYIGTGNRRLYENYGARPEQLLPAPYCVDNARFRQQAEILRPRRAEIRRGWGIPEEAFVPLFCGKFIAKKRPMDLVRAAASLINGQRLTNIHLLFAGSGELGTELRAACDIAFDAEQAPTSTANCDLRTANRVPVSFVGFLNQSHVSEAYVTADCLVLPSDHGETWGLVVNEAMASGLPCIISDRCGSAEDLGAKLPNRIYSMGDVKALADGLHFLHDHPVNPSSISELLSDFSFERSVQTVAVAYNTLKQS